MSRSGPRPLMGDRGLRPSSKGRHLTNPIYKELPNGLTVERTHGSR